MQPMQRKKGLVLSAQLVLAVLLVLIVLGISAGVGWSAMHEWRTRTAHIQAEQIDAKLIEYAESHTSAYGDTIRGGTNQYNVQFTKTKDYPISISEIGEIGERIGGGTVDKALQGYFPSPIRFTNEPQQHLYEFHYIPRNAQGKEISPSSNDPVTFYTIEYFTEDAYGEVKRNVSPRSYENLPDDQKHI